jgi:hypothetical protein
MPLRSGVGCHSASCAPSHPEFCSTRRLIGAKVSYGVLREPENDRRRNELSVHCVSNSAGKSTDIWPLGLNLDQRHESS